MAEPLITYGSRVRLHFTLHLADGTLVDASDAGTLDVVIGRGDLLDSLERCLLGLAPGEQRRFRIPQEEAPVREGCGEVTMDRADFPAGIDVVPGTVLAFEAPNGEEIPGTVTAVTDATVTVDFTHPLAGHELVFEVDIVAVDLPHGPGGVGGS